MSNLNQVFADGIAHHQAGRLREAEEAYRLLLQARPEEAQVWYLYGGLAYQMGSRELAAENLGRATRLAPHSFDYAFECGLVVQELNRFEAAEACFRRASELVPTSAEIHFYLANALSSQEKMGEAISAYQRAIELKPDFAEAHYNLGNALKSQGQATAALAHYQRAIQSVPNFAEAFNGLGGAYREMHAADQAITHFKLAVEFKPELAEAHANLGTGLRDLAQPVAAVTHLRRALQLQPEFPRAHSNLLYSLLFCPGYDAAAILQEHRRWNDLYAQPLARSIERHRNDRDPQRRLRIGYVSPDFRDHVQACFHTPLFAHHDHEQFEVFCYSDVVVPDAITTKLRNRADAWRDIRGMNDEQVAELVRSDGIDILVDLTMHMERNRLLVFARKPAPVQVTWLAYPGTTGLTAIDYRLTDPWLDPPAQPSSSVTIEQLAGYSERSVRLPESFWCYDPLTTEPLVNGLPADRNGFITFGSLNYFGKVNPSVLQLWAGVLRAVPNSRLLLSAPAGSSRRWVAESMQGAGGDAGRVEFVERVPRAKYLELYHRIDIGLDTLPYNGHTTSLDSYWMGVPVVTIVGSTVVGRAGLSQLTNLGLQELIAKNADEFVRIAADLAGDVPRLRSLRASLRERMQNSPLMDGARFVRGLEAAYRAMWQAGLT